MKKFFLAAFSAALISGFAMAGTPDKGDKNKDEGTYFSHRSFYENFGDVPGVQWTASDQYDKAAFMKDGKAIDAFFSKDGDFIGTIQQVLFTDLPASAQKFIQKKYGSDNIVSILDFDDNELSDVPMYINGNQIDEDNYFVELKDKDQKNIVLEVTHQGDVSYFDQMK